MKKQKTVDELKENAIIFWPIEICKKEQSTSVIPLLLKSHEKFISILHLSDSDPMAWKQIVDKVEDMPSNLFLKHLCVLSDIGGEKLMRFRSELPTILDNNELIFNWKNKQHKVSIEESFL
ncbi:hypothetical protein [Desulfobacterium sp. N47]|uniref:BanI/HgiCI N-terminal domain-containing protein n=1 Tax=uncultured Desulfobacterium sp. TaxID=201089 RepID=E1Y9F7_9BACT|nr:hypothetical protein N47_A12300 [uncultured Desulfobacterium sp.]